MSISTLRRWERTGKLVAEHSAGGHRRYDLSKLRPELCRCADTANRRTGAYARVSSHDQKADLERQKQVLELDCARQGWTFEVVADLGRQVLIDSGVKRGDQVILNPAVDLGDGTGVKTRPEPAPTS